MIEGLYVYVKVCPTKLKSSICISDFIQTIFFYLGRFLKKLADDQCSSITKSSIYHCKHIIHTTFYHSNELTRNLMFNGNIYYVLYFVDTAFLLGTAEVRLMTNTAMTNCDVIVRCPTMYFRHAPI